MYLLREIFFEINKNNFRTVAKNQHVSLWKSQQCKLFLRISCPKFGRIWPTISKAKQGPRWLLLNTFWVKKFILFKSGASKSNSFFSILTWCACNRHQKSPSPVLEFPLCQRQYSFDLHKNKTLKHSKIDLEILGVCYMHTMLKCMEQI